MTKALLIGFLVLFCHFCSFSQNLVDDKEEWFYGKVILTKGDTLLGTMQYEMQSGILKFRAEDNALRTFSALQVVSFNFYDTILKTRRYFYSFTEKKGDYGSPTFFGVLYFNENKVSLFYKENSRYAPIWNTKALTKEIYELYFIFPDKSVKRYRKSKKSLFNTLPEHHAELKNFISDKSIHDLNDLIKILEFYNSL